MLAIPLGLLDMENLFDLLQEKQEITDSPDAAALALVQGEVRFNPVSFGYDARRPILKNVSFTAGHTVAVVGASGAGKSTLSRLLFRFYEVNEGSVSIDGQNIRHLTQASLRQAIGIVPQDTVLFNDTLRDNIGYGKTGSSDEEIERAAKLAHIHEFIVSLPDGYEARVGERVLKLSGGEMQRVVIASTILKNPAILVFDEATSALDTQTEREIQVHLREVSRNHTALVIAHRLSTVVEADEIIVLEAGEIVERGGMKNCCKAVAATPQCGKTSTARSHNLAGKPPGGREPDVCQQWVPRITGFQHVAGAGGFTAGCPAFRTRST